MLLVGRLKGHLACNPKFYFGDQLTWNKFGKDCPVKNECAVFEIYIINTKKL